jgi:two-component system NtrC family response regulator
MNDFGNNVCVLAVSPQETDLAILSRILSHSAWTVLCASSVAEAKRLLSCERVHVLLSECRLSDGDWKDLLSATAKIPDAPQLIVISRDGDERLWAEVLNLGAWDVIVKPFHPKEVFRTIHAAWQHWVHSGRITPRRPVGAEQGSSPFVAGATGD